MLIEKGAIVNAEGRDDDSALIRAAAVGNISHIYNNTCSVTHITYPILQLND